MKETSRRIVTSLILCLFVNFVFSNTVFLHSHVAADGHLVTHSHPYLPSSGHGHSAMQFDQIAAFNASAAAMDSADLATILTEDATLTFLSDTYQPGTVSVLLLSAALRAPPAA